MAMTSAKTVFTPIQEKKKQKPNQIIVVHRDEETNELIKTFVDKKKKVRVSKLKRVIREHRAARRLPRPHCSAHHPTVAADGYETVYETDYNESEN